MEGQALETYRKPLTAAEVKAQVQVIQEILDAVMIKDVHYGTIPGTPKPTLYKPGSEKILATFHIASDPRMIEDLSTEDEVRYRVKVYGVSYDGCDIFGVGIGEASSNEEKYRWKRPVCDEEWEETAPDRRREVWKKGNPKNYKVKQIRTNPADVANTILKMAKKRAQIDMTLTTTAASDVFEQDLEDMDEGTRETVVNGKKPPMREPGEKKQEGSAMASEAQVKAIHSILSAKEPNADHLIWVAECLKVEPETLAHVSVETITKDMAMKIFDVFKALGWTKEK